LSQLRFLQSLARTGIHALDPALDLLNGQSVMTAGLTDLDLESSSRTEAFDPPIFLQPREAKSRRFVECSASTSTEWEMPVALLKPTEQSRRGTGRVYPFRYLFV
jgi:hypothetical protein